MDLKTVGLKGNREPMWLMQYNKKHIRVVVDSVDTSAVLPREEARANKQSFDQHLAGKDCLERSPESSTSEATFVSNGGLNCLELVDQVRSIFGKVTKIAKILQGFSVTITRCKPAGRLDEEERSNEEETARLITKRLDRKF
jgi:hypothetical protein